MCCISNTSWEYLALALASRKDSTTLTTKPDQFCKAGISKVKKCSACLLCPLPHFSLQAWDALEHLAHIVTGFENIKKKKILQSLTLNTWMFIVASADSVFGVWQGTLRIIWQMFCYCRPGCIDLLIQIITLLFSNFGHTDLFQLPKSLAGPSYVVIMTLTFKIVNNLIKSWWEDRTSLWIVLDKFMVVFSFILKSYKWYIVIAN